MAIALHHSRAKGSARLVLIGIANHDGDGGAWPSNKTLAKYAGVSVEQVRKNVRKLEELGEVQVFQQQGGTASTPEHMRPNLYKFQLSCPPTCDRTKNHRTREPLVNFDPPSPMQGGNAHEGGAPHMHEGGHPSPSRAEPPINHPLKKKPNRVSTEQVFWEHDRCPGNHQTAQHELGSYAKCLWCHEPPLVKAA